MSDRLTKRQGSQLRLTREAKRPSPFDRLDIAGALGATRVIEHGVGGGNPLAKARARSLWTGGILTQIELPAEDLRLIEELFERLRERLATVDRGQILRALVHRELRLLRQDREHIEQEIAEYLTATSGGQEA
jgi:hypothetical protein